MKADSPHPRWGDPAAIRGAIHEKKRLMVDKLKTLQNADGGFRAFYTHDPMSGVWSTAEIVHLAAKATRAADRDWLKPARDYLIRCQNADGGWPFRSPGKSITDVTAWCILALAHFGEFEAVERGIRFILRTRINEGSSPKEDGWGLTEYEQDRVYSTWIASYSLQRLLARHGEHFSAPLVAEVDEALTLAKDWLQAAMAPTGGWPPMRGSPPQVTSTAVALLTLFMQGADPNAFTLSRDFLLGALRSGLWPPENEIVVTQEGYELTQEWFTSPLALRALIFFAELGLVELREVDAIFIHLMELIHEDGSVSMAPGTSPDFTWTIPFMLDALSKYERFIQSKGKLYTEFLEKQLEHRVRVKRKEMDGLLGSSFPYPVSHAFSAYQHELEYHRKFELLLQVYEITVRYAALVGLSGYLLAKEQVDRVDASLNAGDHGLGQSSLGYWTRLLEALLQGSEGFAKLLYPLTGGDLTKSLHNHFDNAPMKLNLSQLLSSVVNLRNRSIGHGAVRTLYEYKLVVEQEEPKLYSFLDRLSFLAMNNSFLVLASEYDEFGQGDRYKIRIFKGLSISDSDLETASRLSEGQRASMVRYIYFQNTANNTIVNLYPFVSYMFCEVCTREQFFFYNRALDDRRIVYLSYSCSHERERENGEHFRKRLGSHVATW